MNKPLLTFVHVGLKEYMFRFCSKCIQICTLLLLVAGPLDVLAADTETSSKYVPVGHLQNKMYELGRTRAREKTGYPGTFVLGVVTGMTLPFVSLGVGNFACEAAGDNGLAGVAGGLAGAVIWVKGGSKLTKRTIVVPEYYHSNHTATERMAFDAGYRDLAEEKRMSRFTGGAFLGAFVPVALFVIALSGLNLSG